MYLTDYSNYYDLESYLLNTVADNFRTRYYLTAEELFCIIIWKANRAKSIIARKFEGEASLEEAVKKLSSCIYEASSNNEKIAILM